MAAPGAFLTPNRRTPIHIIMAQKFIISEGGTLRFGDVHLHRDLFQIGEDTCYGGGFWTIDHSRNAIILHGRSFDFGGPDFGRILRIDWCGIGGHPRPLFYAPYHPSLDLLEPVFVGG